MITLIVAGVIFFSFIFYISFCTKEAKEEKRVYKERQEAVENIFGSKKEYSEAVSRSFYEFLDECKETVPYAPKNPEAALYRYAWRRGIMLERIYEEKGLQKEALLVRGHRAIAGNFYDKVAPENAYGKVRLKFTPKQQESFYKKELARLEPGDCTSEVKNLACIYIGRDRNDKTYVGQTINAPELRWAQHREKSTGPYKGDADYVRWDILKGKVPVEKLDYWESFYIGLYDAYRTGYNSTAGNDLQAYQEGLQHS